MPLPNDNEINLNASYYVSLTNFFPFIFYRMKIPEGIYLYVSPGIKPIFGYSPKDLYTQPLLISKIIHDDFHDYFQKQWELLLEGDPPNTYDYKIFHKNGEERWVHQQNHPIYENGRITILEGLITDITKQKEIENELRDIEQKYRELFNGNRDGIVIVSKKGNILDANQSYCQMLGYSLEELLNIPNFYSITPKKWHKYEQEEIWNQKLLKLGYSGVYEKEYIHKSGKIFPVELQATTFFEKDGKTPKYLWGIVRDISERKESEKIILEKARLSAIGELASGVAHDFNNALQSILGNVELAIFDNQEQNVDMESLMTIKQAAEDAAARIDTLLRFSGKYSHSKYGVLDLNNIIQDVINQTRYLWKDQQEKEGKTIEIKTEFQTTKKINGNSNELRSVIYNVIKNAVQAMPNGGKLEFRTFEKNDFIEGKYKDIIAFQVIDSGLGMTEDVKTRLFQPFFTTKGFDQGKGLGMSQVYAIVRDHSGKVFVSDTKLGKGTTIEFNFPALHQSIENMKNDPSVNLKSFYAQDHPPNSNIAQILWVDDEVSILKFARKSLTILGFGVDVTSSPIDAIAMAKNKKYDILITDIGMPLMNGWELIHNIKTISPSTKIIVLTGWDTDLNQVNGLDFSVDLKLTKPVNLKAILDNIHQVLEK